MHEYESLPCKPTCVLCQATLNQKRPCTFGFTAELQPCHTTLLALLYSLASQRGVFVAAQIVYDARDTATLLITFDPSADLMEGNWEMVARIKDGKVMFT